MRSKIDKKRGFDLVLSVLFIGLVYLDIQSSVEGYLKMILLGTIFLVSCYRYKTVRIHNFILLYLGFYLINLISAIYSINTEFYFGNMAILTSILLILISFPKIFEEENAVTTLLNAIKIFGVLLSVRILLTVDLVSMLTGGDYISGILQREIGNRNIIAMLTGLSFNVSMYQFFNNRKKYNLLIMALLLFITLLTGSRKALLFIVIPFLVTLGNNFYNSKSFNIRMKYIVLGLIGLVGLYLLLFKVEFLYLNLGSRLEVAVRGLILNQSVSEGSLNVRSGMIQIGLNAFKQKPLFGYGLENFRYVYGSISGSEGTYSHNNFIEILVNNGLMGFILYYIFFVSVLCISIQKGIKSHLLNEKNYYIFISALLISLLIIDFTMVTYKWYPLYIVFILAMKPMNGNVTH